MLLKVLLDGTDRSLGDRIAGEDQQILEHVVADVRDRTPIVVVEVNGFHDVDEV